MTNLLQQLRDTARSDGAALVGVTPAVTSAGYADLVQWIESGYAGGMDYFARRQEAYRHPASILEGARSIVAIAYPYHASGFRDPPTGQGRIARYCWSGVDYHDTIHAKLKRLCRIVVESEPAAAARGVVDTAPLQEREVAELAGIGWRGKNTLLLNRQLGSYFFLACILTNLELPSDDPHVSSHCGTCTACLDACPTDAFPKPGVLDATRCISYLTIEHRGPIATPLRSKIGDWMFGCDICQEVCPWNRKPARTAAPPDEPLDSLDLHVLFTMSDQQFRERFRKTPLWRTRRRGILRNAAIVLGNVRDTDAVDPLSIGLRDEEPIVRGAAAWGLGQIGGAAARQSLKQRLTLETDLQVREEIEAALSPAH